MSHSEMAGQGYDAQRDAVRAFFELLAPGFEHGTTVVEVSAEVGISKTRAGDILVELERAGELERAKHGRAFVYWRPMPSQNAPREFAGPSGSEDPVEASLALLRFLGGKAYAGQGDDVDRRTIDMTSALALEERGLVHLAARRSYMVAELLEENVAEQTARSVT